MSFFDFLRCDIPQSRLGGAWGPWVTVWLVSAGDTLAPAPWCQTGLDGEGEAGSSPAVSTVMLPRQPPAQIPDVQPADPCPGAEEWARGGGTWQLLPGSVPRGGGQLLSNIQFQSWSREARVDVAP